MAALASTGSAAAYIQVCKRFCYKVLGLSAACSLRYYPVVDGGKTAVFPQLTINNRQLTIDNYPVIIIWRNL